MKKGRGGLLLLGFGACLAAGCAAPPGTAKPAPVVARPVSEPVPEVVGTATTGLMPAGSARVHQSPISSKSHIGRV